MAVQRLFLYGFLALLVSGCGTSQAVNETLHVPETISGSAVCATDKTLVVLPFADYSSGDDVMSTHERSSSVTEALTDQLVGKGFKMPVQEDVTQYLVDKNIITLATYNNAYNAIEEELSGQWSSRMKGEIKSWIEADKRSSAAASGANSNPLAAPGTHALDARSVSKIGRKFNAQYLVRGRIIQYDLQEEHTWQMNKIGILPFVVKGTKQAAFGFAKSEEYDNLDALALWGLAGAIIGYNADTPVDPEKTKTTISGSDIITKTSGDSDDAEFWNSVIWGTGAATMAHLAMQSGKVPEAVVQLRIWIQDTTTGDVVWTNRAEVKVAPESIYGDIRSREMFKTAVSRAATILVDDFWNKTKAVM
jgi:hypothetical protein